MVCDIQFVYLYIYKYLYILWVVAAALAGTATTATFTAVPAYCCLAHHGWWLFFLFLPPGIMRSFEPLPCPICQRSYSSPGNLKQHLENIHMASNDLQFECRICGNKFKSKWYLHKHLHRAHHIRGRKEIN